MAYAELQLHKRDQPEGSVTNIEEKLQRPSAELDAAGEHPEYAHCILWRPIPVLSSVLPWLGHVAICDSHGRAHTFEESGAVAIDNSWFSPPYKYHKLMTM